jgi:hypothetical protein
MDKVENFFNGLSDSEYQEAIRPIVHKTVKEEYYLELVDEKSNEKTQLSFVFTHYIHRTFFTLEFTYSVEVHLTDANGPLYPIDEIHMEIRREIDNSKYTISGYNSAQTYHHKAFRPGSSGISWFAPVVVMNGYEYRWVEMWQSANDKISYTAKKLD